MPFGEILSVNPFGGADEPGRAAAFLVLFAFLVTFLFIRTSARMIRAQVSWWPGDVTTDSGLHLHHLVWGISLMLLSGFLAFAMAPDSPWFQICAAAFGIGAGLTLDEFALWIHLQDVYWTDEGRSSLDAVVFVAAFMLLVVVGTRPFGLDEPESAIATAIIVFQALLFASISFLKGRIFLGVVAIFIPFFGIWATCRIGKPNSPWARRFYKGHREHKLEQARERFRPDSPGHRTWTAVLNAIGGRPSEPDPPPAP